MAAITWPDVEDHVAAMTVVGSDAQTDILAHVHETVNIRRLGGEDGARTRLARIYYAAHLGQLWLEDNAAAGADNNADVRSEEISANSMKLEYGDGSTSDDTLKSTRFGRRYLSIADPPCRIGLIPRNRC